MKRDATGGGRSVSQDIRIDKSHEDKGLRCKDDLRAYNETLRRIDGLEKRIADFKATMYSPSTSNISDMPRVHNATGISRQERVVVRLEEMQHRLAELVELEARQYKKITAALQRLDPDEDLLLSLRYIDRRRWNDITEELFGYEDDYEENFDRYQKRAFRIHGRSLENLEKIYDELYPA